MTPELGHLALILALVIAIVQATLPIAGAARADTRWMSLARPAAQLQFALVVVAFGCLVHAFLVNDFSVTIVTTHSNASLPSQYRFAATWGSHEGSLLLWVLLLAAWGAAVAAFSDDLPAEVVARVLGVMGIIAVGFLVVLLLTSNPFQRMIPAALEGRDLNPVLQDWGMVTHPPMLYMGYVGFAVCFAFAIAGLLGNTLDATWARSARPWTIAAWCFLTLGIALGSWWAYRVLGWGGWWFWDPVENASFMPWLVGTALIHSLAVTDRRGAFRSWTVLLAIITFSLSVLGTFLVRSGVLNSVHTFANDPKRGVFMLAFLTVIVGGSLAVFAWRAPRGVLGRRFSPLSRETMLLANNLLLAVGAATIFLGTIYPLVLDAFGAGKISVGAPYFDTVFVPLIAPLALLIGIGPLTRWKEESPSGLSRRLRWPAVFVLSLSLVVLALPGGSAWVAFGLSMSAWIFATAAAHLLERVRTLGSGLGARLASQSRRYYGMHAAHCGLAIFIAGITLLKGYEIERDVPLRVGESTTVGDYRFRFVGAGDVAGPNYAASRGTVEVFRDAELIDTLFPEKRIFNAQQAVTTEAAIRSRPFGDLYVSLGEPLRDGAWSIRIHSKPFITWIWGGCALMAFGGLLAVSDRRQRRLATNASAAAASRVLGTR